MSDIAKRISNLPSDKLALLLRRTRKKNEERAHVISPQPRDTNIFPLSFAEQRIWFFEQWETESAPYNVSLSVRLTGTLRIETLEQVIHALVQRHEALRTTFTVLEEQPVQIIAPTLTLPLPLVDLTGLSTSEQEAHHLAIAEARLPFDLSNGPLIRLHLLCQRADCHLLLLTMHHIISDGWSLSLFVRELATLYEAFSADKPSPLPDLTIQYVDFTLWQRDWLTGTVLEQQLAYWKQQLHDVPTMLDLPTDHPRPAIQSFRGAYHAFALSPALSEALQTLSNQESVTLFMTLLAAFQVLLFRYTEQADILVGAPIANRTRSDIEHLIGCFINTLVLRTDLSGNPTFRTILARVRDTTLGAYAHQELPFEKLVEELHPERSLSHTPLFQVMFILRNAARSAQQLPGLTIQLEETSNGTTKFDITLTMTETKQGLTGTFEYKTDLFEEDTIIRMARHFQELLTGIVKQPEQRIAELPLLTADEQRQLLIDWTATDAAYPRTACLHHLFEAQVEHTPDATALEYEHERLSYATLNRQANQLAHYLRRLGVGPETRVGLCLKRSPLMLVGLLAILKAGGAFVPVDPTYPAQRVSLLLNDAQIALLLTQEGLLAEYPPSLSTIFLDTGWLTLAGESEENPVNSVSAENLAYILYTSGSTGRPKGVMIPHRGLVNYLHWCSTTYTIERGQGSLVHTPLGFDLTLTSLLSPLLQGQRVALLPDRGEVDALATALRAGDDWSILKLTPSHLEMLSQLLPSESIQQCARTLVIGGEALFSEHFSFWRTADPATRLINEYGPTETVVGCCIYEVPDDIPATGAIPIGRPIANTQLYVLDSHLSPLPVGVPGELYIAGDGLARGYFMQPEVTAARFIPNPFSTEAGQRLYKTGDIVRFRPDGVLEYLGRNDQQIKLRGFRIETGEIESTLRQHPEVQEAVVLLREDSLTHPQLVAYVVLPEQGEDEMAASGTQQVAQWQAVFEQMYREALPAQDALLNLAGWTSSYTGQPIPTVEMREWVEHTVDRLLALQPQHVLEIGCGSGLLLLRLAPHCQGYTGTDFSHVALSTLEQHVLPHVRLLERWADDFTGLELGSYDLVILNSVVQYFPSAEYLLSVLQGALELLKPRGTLFVGDVRHLGLLELFHTSVELHWAKETLSIEQLHRRIQQRIQQEAELLINPAFFHALPGRFSSIARAQTLLKRGLFANELTRFRYDVLLTKAREQASGSLPPGLYLDWREQPLDQTQIRHLLQKQAPPILTLTHIPNARLTSEVQAHERLTSEQLHTVADLRRELDQHPVMPAIEPEELWEACNGLPYTVSLHWSGAERDGCFQAVFLHQSLIGTISAAPQPNAEKLTVDLTNHPLHNQFVNQRIAILREYLKARLPDYMLPSTLVPLDHLPVTANGKMDRRALPLPGASTTEESVRRATPRNATEEQLVQIWSQILGLEALGVHDNFFEAGGHSLLAIRLIARLREVFQLDLPLRTLFESPTIAELARTIQQMKGKPDGEPAQAISWPIIAPQPEQLHEPFPLTDVQQAYWIGRNETFELGNVATHIYIELETSDLDIERLNRAWQRLIERHPMLHAIVSPDGQQQILPQVPFYRIPVLDLRELRIQEATKRLEEVRQRMSHQMLPTDRWPLFDLRASYLDQGRVRLHLSADALMMDAGSWQILVRELTLLYQNAESALPALDLSFRDYVLAERAFRTSELYQRALAYWQHRLPTLPPAPTLPLTLTPAWLSQPRFTRREARLEANIWSRLKNRATRAGLTPSALLLAAFAEILTAWSQQPRFTINLTLFNRLPLHPQVNEIIGDFTSLTLLEVDNTVQSSFITRARRLQERLWEDLDHRYVSGVYMLRELARTRESNTQAIMPVVFTSTLTQENSAPIASPLGKMIYGISQTPQVWLDHQIGEQRGALTYNWDAVEELFPPGLLDDMFDAYSHFLHALAETEESWHEESRQLLPLSQLAQREQVNDTAAPVPSGLLHTLFWEQVAQRPQQPAIIAPDRTLTYAELYRASQQLGSLLQRQGALPNTLIAIVMEKGWEQVVAALGILQSGAAYLPIDATLPKARLWYLLEHGEVNIVLTQSWLLTALEWPQHVHQVYCVDTLDEIDDAGPLAVVQQPDDLAYVIYTSGSTGLPKGVMIDHRGAVNTIVDINQRFGVGPADRVLALSSLSFDLSVYDIFGLLATGGTIVFPEATSQRDPAHWARLIKQERITLWNTVPALMQMLAEYMMEHPEYVPLPLRLVLLSGDWIPLSLPKLITDLTNHAQIISLGGATEASIWSILYPIHAVDSNWRSIPYGRPMLNQRFHVLNETLEPRPTWVPGHLYIGGIGLAQGYWRDKEKTLTSFIVHPAMSERLYHTGDLGRYLPDGTIEFLGREDFQVKIQGYRIEPGEIEAALALHPAVRTALVTATSTANRYLVAYLVLDQSLTAQELRAFLAERLPAYMIPTSFMFLDALPLTANGKIDRQALPEPVLPQTTLEVQRAALPFIEQIQSVVTEVLQVAQIEPAANLLDLGANSIDLLRIVNALEKTLHFRPRIAEIFRSPTIVTISQAYVLHLHQNEQSFVTDDREEGEL